VLGLVLGSFGWNGNLVGRLNLDGRAMGLAERPDRLTGPGGDRYVRCEVGSQFCLSHSSRHIRDPTSHRLRFGGLARGRRFEAGLRTPTPETYIDGEFTSYRAIQPLAIISVVFGVLSVVCFLDILLATA